MNKRYIDFVPPKSDAHAASSVKTSTRVTPRAASTTTSQLHGHVTTSVVASRTRSHVTTAKQAQHTANLTEKRSSAATSPRQSVSQINFTPHASGKAELGVIEDLSPKFINTKTEKRPLNSGKSSSTTRASSSLKAAKSQRVGNKAKPSASIDKSQSTRQTTKKASAASKYKTPKSPFINLDKITKRPLSKNVYQKKVETPKELPAGPVTIIAKPEKDSRVGLVITIILTIILGAVAGTVAFLLLPK